MKVQDLRSRVVIKYVYIQRGLSQAWLLEVSN